MKRYDHVVSAAFEHPWAITRPMLATIAAILSRHIAGLPADAAVIQAAVQQRRDLPQPRVGAVGVIPVYGVIAPKASLFSDISGGTSLEAVKADLRKMLADDSVATIVLDIDSPGGNVAGVTELAREILKARTTKPVVAIANYTMASAAYWLGAAATEVIASPSARVGAAGVYTIHDDLSKAFEMDGVKRTYISAGEGKVDGNSAEPLSEEARAKIQGTIDEVYALMVKDISNGRGVKASVVTGEWKSDLYSADQALTRGMVDRVATYDETLARLTGQRRSSGSARAAIVDDPVVAVDGAVETVAALEDDAPADPDLTLPAEAALAASDAEAVAAVLAAD